MSVFQSILYPPPPSLLRFISAAAIVAFANSGIQEVRGTHLSYSKFWNWNAAASRQGSGATALSARTGMLLLYSPALAAAAAALFIPAVLAAPRGSLVSAALGLHFLKRVLEVRLPPSLYKEIWIQLQI